MTVNWAAFDNSKKAISTLPFLFAVLLWSCAGSAQSASDATQFNIGASLAAIGTADPAPVVTLGQTTFRASDPTTVSLASGRVQFIEFFAYWCSVCKAMAPTVNGLESRYGDVVNFIYLDRDDPATIPLRDQLGYVYQPHFFLLDAKGAILAQWRGYVDGEVLQQAIVEALN